MATNANLNPFVLSKFVLWIAVVAITTVLLRRQKLSGRVRLAVVLGGTLIFGFLYGILLRSSLNPNPVVSLRMLLGGLAGRQKLLLPSVAMFVVLLLLSWISNKSLCGNGCQLGLLQDLLYRIPAAKWQPPFRISNGVRIIAFLGLVGGVLIVGVDWIAVIDPFQIFQFQLTWPITIFSAVVLTASVFIYRPWCRFLCPFGLLSWGVEQVSLMRPRIDRTACKECQACVRACPSGAMQDFYAGKPLHRDCFACGACIEACPVKEALKWRK